MPGLELTNNFSERCIRHAVTYRKTSFGTRSGEGSRFVERIFTATTTLKLQGREKARTGLFPPTSASRTLEA